MSTINTIIERSPIKVLWLDTSCIWKLDVSIWQKIAKLVLRSKIIVVDTGQQAEMLERYSRDLITLNESSKAKLEIYENIVGEYFSMDHSSFLARQIKTAMRTYTSKQTEVSFSFFDLFDPLMREILPFLDFLNALRGDTWGTARRFKKLSPDIVIDWKQLRLAAKQKKSTIIEQRNKELLGMYEAIKKVSESSDIVKKKNLVASYLRKWNRITGNDDLDLMLKFFKSDYYRTIPYADIHSWLISDLIVGNEEPRLSDYFDIIMISMILPFADFMVVDGPMRNRIVNQVKLVKPKGRYDCKIILHRDLEAELNLVK